MKSEEEGANWDRSPKRGKPSKFDDGEATAGDATVVQRQPDVGDAPVVQLSPPLREQAGEATASTTTSAAANEAAQTAGGRDADGEAVVGMVVGSNQSCHSEVCARTAAGSVPGSWLRAGALPA